jgi:nitrogen regulation protein NR(I)
MMKPVWIVDDDRSIRWVIEKALSREGIAYNSFSSAQEALDALSGAMPEVLVSDIRMPGRSGLELLQAVKQRYPAVPVIVMTAYSDLDSAVAAFQGGAYEYLPKPFDVDQAVDLIRRALEERRRDTQANEPLPETEILGQAPAMQEVFRAIGRLAQSNATVLITGESGTGKELVARALHECSQRADRPMVVINCAALPETLLESELFGHEKGSFTGAVAAKPGLFEVADGGTLFIDEIGEMPGPLQAKLLRVLEDGSMRRIGSIKERRVNVRLLAATNRHMSQEVAAGRFREDLYYRINVMSLELPPLRERAGDVPLLVRHFLGPGWEVDPDVLPILERYHWPGNVRQLINALERAKILADENLVRARDLPDEITASAPHDSPPSVQDVDDLATIQRVKIVEVLRRVGGNKTHAAKALGIERRKLYRLLEKYQIQDAEISPTAVG